MNPNRYTFAPAYPKSYTLPASVANYRVYPAQPEQEDAWKLLTEGQPQLAQQVFARQAEGSPSDSVVKLGYALAAALSGDFVRAEWAMRRAFKTDANRLQSKRISGSLKQRLVSVAKYYQESLALNVANPNAAFMMAALKFIDREHQPANRYIELAIDSGDIQTSTINLKQQLSAMEES